MNFALGGALNPSKVFIEKKSNVIGRWDPFYSLPELVVLERTIQEVAQHSLRDLVRYMAGGATPSTKEAETHYTESDDGVPFIRVQNLSTTGRLDLEECKRITRVTHEGMLRRSRLSGGELLVKITGVGRMAVASVVPVGFEGNINQHIVAIRTDSFETSEMLAAYLNLDMVERLASRRSTGGTRPALDYPALLSIPVVLDEHLTGLINTAVDRFQKQINEATALLSAIDDVLLEALGIPREPERSNALEKRIFFRKLSDVSGTRFDPVANQERRRALEQSIRTGSYPVTPLHHLVAMPKALVTDIAEGETYVGLENIDGDSGDYIFTTEKESVGTAARFEAGQILFPKLRPYLNKTHLAGFAGICSTEFHVFAPHGIGADFLKEFLRSRVIVGITSLLMTGNTLPRLQIGDIEGLPIPVPPKDVQEHLCEKISGIRAKASKLRQQAREDFKRAKSDVEALILGDEDAA